MNLDQAEKLLSIGKTNRLWYHGDDDFESGEITVFDTINEDDITVILVAFEDSDESAEATELDIDKITVLVPTSVKEYEDNRDREVLKEILEIIEANENAEDDDFENMVDDFKRMIKRRLGDDK